MKQTYKICVYMQAINPATYVLGAAFTLSLAVGFFVFQQFFAAGTGLHRFFAQIPVVSIFILPAFSSIIPCGGSSLPQKDSEITVARMLAGMSFLVVFLVLTLPVPLYASSFMQTEPSLVLTAYTGVLLYLTLALAICLLFTTLFEHQWASFLASSLFLAVTTGIKLKAFSFAWHFDAFSKGILDSREIIFFLAFTALALWLSCYAMDKKRGCIKPHYRLSLLPLTLILLLADSAFFYFRIDTTKTKRFTLSTYTAELLSELEEPLVITYYRSKRIARNYPQAKDIKEFLSLYAQKSRLVFFSEKDAEAVSPSISLDSMGIAGQKMQTDSTAPDSAGLLYSGIAIEYLGNTQTVPFILGTDTLEFDVASRIQSLVRSNGQDTNRMVQIAVGNGLSLSSDYRYVIPWLESQGFTAFESHLPSDKDVFPAESLFSLHQDIPLILLGSSECTWEDAEALASFLSQGGNAVIATTPYTVDLQNEWTVTEGRYLPYGDAVTTLLRDYGIMFKSTITAEGAGRNLTLALAKEDNATEYVDYSLWPVLSVQRGASDGLPLFWPAAIDTDSNTAAAAGISIAPYLTTSAEAWQEKPVSGSFITNPFFVQKTAPAPAASESAPYTVAVSISRAKSGQTPHISSIIIGDQYATTTSMIAYASASRGAPDTRSLTFLSDSLFMISGQEALLELRNAQTERPQNLRNAQDVYSFAKKALAVSTVLPVCILLALYLSVRQKRKRFLTRSSL